MRTLVDNRRKARLWLERLRAKRARLPLGEYIASSSRDLKKLWMRDPRLYTQVLKRIHVELDKLNAELSLPFDEWQRRLFRRARYRNIARRPSAPR
jgi:hypothetical protein